MSKEQMVDSAEKVRGWLKELFELLVLNNAITIYNLTDVDGTIILKSNTELHDSIITFRNRTNINVKLKDTLEYNHFWNFICNGETYKTPEEQPHGMDSIPYTPRFNPQWNTAEDLPDRENMKYKIAVKPGVPDDLTGTLSAQELKEKTNEPLTGQTYSFKTDDVREPFNEGVVDGFEYMEGKLEEQDHNRQLDFLTKLTKKLLSTRKEANTEDINTAEEDFSEDSANIILIAEDNNWDVFIVSGEQNQYLDHTFSQMLKKPGDVSPENLSNLEQTIYDLYTTDTTIIYYTERNRIITEDILAESDVVNALVTTIDNNTDFEYLRGEPEEYEESQIQAINDIITDKVTTLYNQNNQSDNEDTQ